MRPSAGRIVLAIAGITLFGVAGAIATEWGQLGNERREEAKTPPPFVAGSSIEGLRDVLLLRAQTATTVADFRAILHEVETHPVAEASYARWAQHVLRQVARFAPVETWDGRLGLLSETLWLSPNDVLPRSDANTRALVDRCFPRLGTIEKAADQLTSLADVDSQKERAAVQLLDLMLTNSSTGAFQEVAHRLPRNAIDELERALPAVRRADSETFLARVRLVQDGVGGEAALQNTVFDVETIRRARRLSAEVLGKPTFGPRDALWIAGRFVGEGKQEQIHHTMATTRWMDRRAIVRLLLALPAEERRNNAGFVQALFLALHPQTVAADPTLRACRAACFPDGQVAVQKLRAASRFSDEEVRRVLRETLERHRTAALDFGWRMVAGQTEVDDLRAIARAIQGHAELIEPMRPLFQLTPQRGLPPDEEWSEVSAKIFEHENAILAALRYELASEAPSLASVFTPSPKTGILHYDWLFSKLDEDEWTTLEEALPTLGPTDNPLRVWLTHQITMRKAPQSFAAIVAGPVVRPAVVPAQEDLTADFSARSKLTVDGFQPEDLVQSWGDCYLAALLASIAHLDPSFFGSMIRPDPEHPGRHRVRMIANAQGRVPYARWYDVNAILPATRVDAEDTQSASFRPRAMLRSTEGDAPIEVWGALIEKVAAEQMRGNYEKLGRGGHSYDAALWLVGSVGHQESIADLGPEGAVDRIETLLREQKAVVAYTSTYPHVVAVLNVKRVGNQRTVTTYDAALGVRQTMPVSELIARHSSITWVDLSAVHAAERNAWLLPAGTALGTLLGFLLVARALWPSRWSMRRRVSP